MNAGSTAVDHARDVLDSQVVPALFELRDTMESLLETYTEELRERAFYLWHVNTVFKFVLPPPRKEGAKEPRDEEEEESDEERAADIGKEPKSEASETSAAHFNDAAAQETSEP